MCTRRREQAFWNVIKWKGHRDWWVGDQDGLNGCRERESFVRIAFKHCLQQTINLPKRKHYNCFFKQVICSSNGGQSSTGNCGTQSIGKDKAVQRLLIDTFNLPAPMDFVSNFVKRKSVSSPPPSQFSFILNGDLTWLVRFGRQNNEEYICKIDNCFLTLMSWMHKGVNVEAHKQSEIIVAFPLSVWTWNPPSLLPISLGRRSAISNAFLLTQNGSEKAINFAFSKWFELSEICPWSSSCLDGVICHSVLRGRWINAHRIHFAQLVPYKSFKLLSDIAKVFLFITSFANSIHCAKRGGSNFSSELDGSGRAVLCICAIALHYHINTILELCIKLWIKRWLICAPIHLVHRFTRRWRHCCSHRPTKFWRRYELYFCR